MTVVAEDLHDFWFGDIQAFDDVREEKTGMWFLSSSDYDKKITELFHSTLLSAASGQHESWKQTDRGYLSLILLFDQIPRHIYRNSGDSFKYDSLARALTKEGIEKGIDKNLTLIERMFFYLPLEHSENLEDQALCCKLMKELKNISPKLETSYEFAVAHFNLIEKFGRFPHRNKALGRESTQKELEHLTTHGRGF